MEKETSMNRKWGKRRINAFSNERRAVSFHQATKQAKQKREKLVQHQKLLC